MFVAVLVNGACLQKQMLVYAGQGVRIAGEPDAAAAAGAALHDLRALAARLEAQQATAAGTQEPAGGGPHAAARRRALLSLVRLLQLYIGGDAAAAEPELAGDLALVCEDAFRPGGAQNHKESPNPGSDPSGGGEPPWADRLLDVLLSLLARPAAPLPSAPLREAVEATFRVFTDAITPTGVSLPTWCTDVFSCQPA